MKWGRKVGVVEMALQHFQHSCRPSLCSFHGTVLFFHALFVFLCFYCCVVEQAIVMDSCFSVVVVHCHRLFIFFVFRFCFPFHSVRAHVKSDVFNDCDIESHEFIMFSFCHCHCYLFQPLESNWMFVIVGATAAATHKNQ